MPSNVVRYVENATYSYACLRINKKSICIFNKAFVKVATEIAAA